MSTAEAETSKSAGNPMRRRITIYAAVLLAVFLVGLIPMWLLARGRATERDAAQHDLRLCRFENNLLSAAIDSRRGEYERARVAASNFFTSLREQVDLVSEPSDLTSAQRESLRPLLNQRDDLITLLARSDPASADRLMELYVSFRKAMNNAQP
jgi:type II secretory pathway pseudopilin PulG